MKKGTFEHKTDHRPMELQILDRFPLGITIWRLDFDGTTPTFLLQEANEAASGFVGFDLEPEIGRPLESIFSGEEVRRWASRWREQLESPEPREPRFLVYGDARVPESTFETRTFPVGQDTMMVLFDNVTARVELERRQNAIERLNSLGRLAGGVAHDFNNVLTVIVSNIELLIELGELGAEAKADAEAIRTAALRGASLTRNLLTISKRQPLEPHRVQINDRLVGHQRFLDDILGSHIELTYELAQGETPVWIDPVQFDQVLLNLAVNARDAMPSGGSVRIKTDVVDLDEEYVKRHPEAKPGRHVRIEMQDDGVGMDEHTADHIFEPFFTTKAHVGNGIGLATVYGVVSRAGGHITVRSTLGVGTCFEVLLPFGEDSPLEGLESLAEVPTSTEAHERTILVVDDEPPIRRAIERIFATLGDWRVLLAETAEEAVMLWRSDAASIDIVLTDVRLPFIDGVELVEQLEAEGLDVPVIFMSGYADSAATEAGLVDSKRGFIGKPFNPDELLDKVRSMCP